MTIQEEIQKDLRQLQLRKQTQSSDENYRRFELTAALLAGLYGCEAAELQGMSDRSGRIQLIEGVWVSIESLGFPPDINGNFVAISRDCTAHGCGNMTLSESVHGTTADSGLVETSREEISAAIQRVLAPAEVFCERHAPEPEFKLGPSEKAFVIALRDLLAGKDDWPGYTGAG
jgi:hypothetical protein